MQGSVTVLVGKSALSSLLPALAVVLATAASGAERMSVTNWPAVIELLGPLHEPMDKPGPYDWLTHHKEAGQTFRQYAVSRPVTLRAPRDVIYVQPIGDFTASQKKIVQATAGFMGLFFSAKVTTRDALPLTVIPASARRKGPLKGAEQLLTTYILDEVLWPRLPTNAAVYIAFTASDLWPGEGWNFVFGMASLRERTGVWSIHRNGDPDGGDDAYRLCLLRTMKTAVHETGHMFSIEHCIRHMCGMNGSNHREESDRRPVWFCPECMAKVCWATGADPVTRYRALARFCREQGLRNEADFFDKSADRIAKTPPAGKSVHLGAPHSFGNDI